MALAVLGASIAAPASAGNGPTASAAKCKKKTKKTAKKKKKCKSAGQTEPTLPGSPTNPTVQAPTSSGTGTPVAPSVTGLALADNPVLGGTTSQGQVTLSSAAPSGGQPVTLGSGDPTRAAVPSSVQVAAGQTSASFPVTTSAGPTVAVTITASVGPSSQNVQLNVVEKPSLESVVLDHQCYPGTGLTGYGLNRVSLDVPAAADTTVALVSSAPADLSVPSSVVVPTGSKSAIFGVNTLQANPNVTVTASLDGIDKTDTASVRDGTSPPPVATSLSLSPTSIAPGGSSTGTVTLDCEALAGGSTVTLSSGSPDVLLPANVIVPQDQLSATFLITTTQAANGDYNITATLGDPQQATLTVNDLGT